MSLYRKYRPQTFEDTVGQEHIAQTLRNALSVSPPRIAHAYLFCGPRGTGKTTSARLLAKCLNCEHGPTATPCNECDFCTRVRDNQTVMDLVEIDAASNTGVDNVRENIIEKVNVAPAQGRYRVYIIDEVHMLSTSSFNALLKTLEEPPAHAIFVLATTDAHKVPPTITSRCQRFDFRRVGPSDIVRRLQYVAGCEGIALEDGAARLIAFTADGALRDALTLLEQVTAFSAEAITEADVRLVLGTVSQELLLRLMDSVAEGDPVSALSAVDNATEEGVSFSQLTRDLVAYGRDLLLLTVGFEGQSALSDDEKRHRGDQARKFGRARLLAFVEALRAAEKEMRQSTDHRLLLELALVRAASGELPAAPALASGQAVPTGVRPARPQGNQAQPAWRQNERPASGDRPVNGRPASEVLVPPAANTAQEGAHFEAVASAEGAEAPNQMIPPVMTDGAVNGVSRTHAEGADLGATDIARGVAEETSDTEAAADSPNGTADYGTPSYGTPPDGTPPDGSAPANEEAERAPETTGVRKKGRRIHDLEEFIELWPAVLTRVRKKIGVTAVAYLHDALPVDLDDKEAVLEFKKEFHYEKACEAAKRLPFEQVLNECMAMPHRLRFKLAPPPKAPPKEPEVQTVVLTDDEDDDDEPDVFTVAQQLFGAEVVGRSGEG